jgi:hypothetical protein
MMNEKDLTGYRKGVEETRIFRQREKAYLKQFKAKEMLEDLNSEFWHKSGIINEISGLSNYEGSSIYYYSGWQLYFENIRSNDPSLKEIRAEINHPNPNIIVGVATETNYHRRSNFLFTKHGHNLSDFININFWDKNDPRGIDERLNLNNAKQEQEISKNLKQTLEDKYSDFMKKEIASVK